MGQQFYEWAANVVLFCVHDHTCCATRLQLTAAVRWPAAAVLLATCWHTGRAPRRSSPVVSAGQLTKVAKLCLADS
ncbi:UNVERIFIED_CONTAM: hypothetical protein ABIC26_004140 [Paenibacillus sp. PvR008]